MIKTIPSVIEYGNKNKNKDRPQVRGETDGISKHTVTFDADIASNKIA